MHLISYQFQTFFVSFFRLICICSSSGGIHLLRVNKNSSEDTNQQASDVQEFARLKLQGDIFSSPLMIGGRIFVGCRDDYLHCVALEIPKQHGSRKLV